MIVRPVLAAIFLLAGCHDGQAVATQAEPGAARDLAAYAMASCFAAQDQPYLKEQGERWAGAVMQRAAGPVDPWPAWRRRFAPN